MNLVNLAGKISRKLPDALETYERAKKDLDNARVFALERVADQEIRDEILGQPVLYVLFVLAARGHSSWIGDMPVAIMDEDGSRTGFTSRELIEAFPIWNEDVFPILEQHIADMYDFVLKIEVDGVNIELIYEEMEAYDSWSYGDQSSTLSCYGPFAERCRQIILANHNRVFSLILGERGDNR